MTRNDVTIILEKKYSSHPGDKHLTVVLAKNYKGEFVTWLYNASPGCEGLCEGHYHNPGFENREVEALRGALDDYEKRGVN